MSLTTPARRVDGTTHFPLDPNGALSAAIARALIESEGGGYLAFARLREIVHEAACTLRAAGSSDAATVRWLTSHIARLQRARATETVAPEQIRFWSSPRLHRLA